MVDSVKMRIGELAKHVGVSTRSLRYYEEQGLLSPLREGNGYRVYDQISIVRARNIKQLFDTGLTSTDVLHYIENGCLDLPLTDAPRCPAELETVQERLDGLDERIARLQRLRERLVSHRAELENAIETELVPGPGAHDVLGSWSGPETEGAPGAMRPSRL